jgi:hypothetical protein
MSGLSWLFDRRKKNNVGRQKWKYFFFENCELAPCFQQKEFIYCSLVLGQQYIPVKTKEGYEPV